MIAQHKNETETGTHFAIPASLLRLRWTNDKSQTPPTQHSLCMQIKCSTKYV